MVAAEHDYGVEMPNYQTAKKQLEEAQTAYQNKIVGVMAGIRTRVNEDQGYLQLIQHEEEQITEEKNKEAQKNRPYYNAKSEVESKRRNYEDLERLLNREVAEQGQPQCKMWSLYAIQPGRTKLPSAPGACSSFLWGSSSV